VEPNDDGPYVLVSSPTQSDLNRTKRIDAPVSTDFHSPSWPQLKEAFIALSEPNDSFILTAFFLVLDEQSMRDRSVVIIEKDAEWFKSDGTEATDTSGAKFTVWKTYRVKFEKAWEVQCGIEGFSSKEVVEPYFVEELEREECAEEEDEGVEEEEDETDSDETTSEDLEYGDFPIKGKAK